MEEGRGGRNGREKKRSRRRQGLSRRRREKNRRKIGHWERGEKEMWDQELCF